MTSKSSYEELEQRVLTLEKELESHKIRKDSDRISQQYLEAILNNTNIPIYLKNADYKYIFMNRQLGSLAHVAHDQVQGKDDFAIFPEPTAQLFRSQDEEVVERLSLIEFEETILLPDGIQTFITAKFPLFDNEGKVSAVGGVCTDITDRKKAETELKEAEEKYRRIFEHSPLGIMHIDKEGIITASNEKLAEIMGSSVEDLVGFDLLQSLQEEQVRSAIISVLSGQISHCEGCFRSVTGGKSLSIRSVFSPISSSGGSIVAAIGIIEDVTSRRNAEEALQAAHDELEQRVAERTLKLKMTHEQLLHAEKLSAIGGLAASIAHEFNNPLQGVVNVIKGIKQRATMDEEDAQLVDSAISECTRMKDLVNSLQDFNRPTSGRMAPMDIHSAIDSVLMLSKNEYQAKGITVETNYADLPQIKAVADQIKQVLLNLLNNASHACSRGDMITISTDVINNEGIRIKIQDTGKGIKPEHIDKIFDPFFTTKPAIKGTGLGLSITYGIIKKHGGRIDVKSEIGKGTIFTITLPNTGVISEK